MKREEAVRFWKRKVTGWKKVTKTSISNDCSITETGMGFCNMTLIFLYRISIVHPHVEYAGSITLHKRKDKI